jgi:hypothetical protein
VEYAFGDITIACSNVDRVVFRRMASPRVR